MCVLPAFSLPLAAYEISITEEETLFVRRIVAFWKDREYLFAKRQIDEFLEKFPSNPYSNSLYAMRGEIALIEGNCRDALVYFDKIQDPQEALAVRLKRCHALYLLKDYTKLKNCLPYILKDPLSKEDHDFYHFYYAESLFRQAASLFNQGGENVLIAKGYCEEAIPHYEGILDGELALHAKIALAEIYRLLGNYTQAADLYLALATHLKEKNDPLKESLLLHAGKMLSKFDTKKALEAFSHLTRFGKKKQSTAALLWANLLADEGLWTDLLESQEEIFGKLAPDKISYFHSLLGKGYFALAQYEEAIEHLEAYLLENATGEEERNALVRLIACYKETGTLDKLELTTFQYMRHYGNDPRLCDELAKVQLLRSFALREAGKLSPALEQLDTLIDHYLKLDNPKLAPFVKEALVEKSTLLFTNKRWMEAYTTSCLYFSHFPKGEHSRYLLKLNISSLTQCITQSEGQGVLAKNAPLYMNLITELKNASEALHLFSLEEIKNFEHLLAKAYYSLGETQKAIPILNRHLSQNPTRELAANLNFDLAFCYIKENRAPEKIVAYGERALTLAIHPHRETRMLHLGLFNAYVEMANNLNTEGKVQAANHLYQAVFDFPKEENTHPVSLENLLWLAHYYYDRREIKKGVQTFEHLLNLNKKSFELPPRLLFLEPEILKLADLYGWDGQSNKQLKLLQDLLTLQLGHPDWPFVCRLKTECAIADFYYEKGNHHEALLHYSNIEKQSVALDIGVIYKARLQTARLLYEQLEPSSRTQQSKEVVSILKKLKDLQVRKILAYEPIHLEAALDYASIYSQTTEEEESAFCYLRLLKQLKNDFSSRQDIWAKDYHASFHLLPEKAAIYNSYMRYIDAVILLAEGDRAHLLGNATLAKNKKSAGTALMDTLKEPLSPYLKEKIGIKQ